MIEFAPIEFAPESKNKMLYDEAVLYCQFLEYKGHRDWRLPTFDEYYHYDRIESWVWYLNKSHELNIERSVMPVRDLC